MSEMVERVRKVLQDACMERFGVAWSNDVSDLFARAAIAAMREPIGKMVSAGSDTDGMDGAPCIGYQAARECWRGMIDEALE